MEHKLPSEQSPLRTLTNQDIMGNDPLSISADDLNLTTTRCGNVCTVESGQCTEFPSMTAYQSHAQLLTGNS